MYVYIVLYICINVYYLYRSCGMSTLKWQFSSADPHQSDSLWSMMPDLSRSKESNLHFTCSKSMGEQ